MGELMKQIMAGGPGMIPREELNPRQREFLEAALSWPASTVGHVLKAIHEAVIRRIAASWTATQGDRWTYRILLDELCRIACMIHDLREAQSRRLTEEEARRILVIMGSGPALFPQALIPHFRWAAQAQAKIWRPGPARAGRVGEIAAAIADCGP